MCPSRPQRNWNRTVIESLDLEPEGQIRYTRVSPVIEVPECVIDALLRL
jgi:hypothetical protein